MLYNISMHIIELKIIKLEEINILEVYTKFVDFFIRRLFKGKYDISL